MPKLTRDDIYILRASKDEAVKGLVERVFRDEIRDELADITPTAEPGAYVVDGLKLRIQPRCAGLYESKGLWLSDDFEWEIVDDGPYTRVLIAKRKVDR